MKWSKLIIAGISLVGCFSVVYSMNTQMSATNASTYATGGSVTGRVNIAPTGISGDNIGLQKGDKIMMDTINPDSQNPLAWQLIIKRKYTDTAGVTGCTPTETTVCKGDSISGWLSLTTESIGNSTSGLTTGSFATRSTNEVKLANYSDTKLYTEIEKLNGKLNENDKRLITYRDFTIPHTQYAASIGLSGNQKEIADMIYAGVFKDSKQLGKHIFLPTLQEISRVEQISPSADYAPTIKDITFPSDYWTATFYYANYGPLKYTNLRPDYKGITVELSGENVAINSSLAIRPAAYLDVNNVVFGVSQTTSSSSYFSVNESNIPAGYGALHLEGGEPMKVRLLNDNLKANLIDVVDTLGNTTDKIAENEFLYLKVDANSMSSTISVLVFDDQNKFIMYKPLQTTMDGTNVYEFDTTGLTAGKTYKLAVVNELYDPTSTGPSDSSYISDTLSITIENPLTALSFTPTHVGGNDLTDVFKTSSTGNVQMNDILAHLSVSNGIGNPNHISYYLLDDTSKSQDYKKFEISVDSTTKYPMKDNGKAYISIKDSNGLLPGVYSFRIQAYDENGNPYPAVDKDGNEITDTSLFNTAKKVSESSFFDGNDITKNNVHGMISDDLNVVVYPDDSQITYHQFKDANKEYYKKGDINKTTFTSHLGELVFGTSADTYANMQALYDAGYRINTSTSKLMKKDSTTEAFTEFKITGDATKPYQFYIDKANNNVTSGDHKFDAWLYFTNGSGDTALLKLKNQNLYIAPSLSYLNPDKNKEAMTSDTYARKYNAYASADNHENKFNLIATDKDDLSTNATMKYCLLDETAKTCAASNKNDVVDIVDNGNGTATLTAKTYFKSDPNIKVRAYIEDSSKTVLTYQDITVQINRAERILKWEGKKFSSLKSTVEEKEDTSAKRMDYTLKIPYDATNPISYSFQQIANMVDAINEGELGLRHDAGTGNISYTLNGNLAAGKGNDSFKVTKQCSGTSCYIEVNKAQDDIFEAGRVRLYITTEDMPTIDDANIGWVYTADNTTWQNTNNPLVLTYKKDGTYPVKINNDILPSNLTDLDIVYSLDDPNSIGTITIANKENSKTEAKLDIKKANQSATNPRIKAEIKSSNYATKTVYLPVNIKKLNQTLEFEDTTFKGLSSVKLDTSASYTYGAFLKVDATTKGGGTIRYSVAGDPVDMITDDATAHSFTVSKVGTVKITAEVTDDINHNTTTANKTITKTITFYDDAGISWKQDDPKPEAINTVSGTKTGNANVDFEFGVIKVDGGKDSNYSFIIDNKHHSDDSTFFTIVKDTTNKAGTLKLIKDVDATILSTHSTQVNVSDEYEWKIHVKAIGVNDATDVAEGDITITFIGAKPEITFTKANTEKTIIDTYQPNKTTDLSIKRNGAAVSDPTINITGYSGVVDILGAIKSANTDNDGNVRSGRKVEVSAQITASGGYKTDTSPLHEVIMKKAEHPDIDFASTTLSSSNNVDVEIEGILHSTTKSNEDVSITPIKASEEDPWIIDTYTISKDQAYASPSISVSPKGYIGTVEFNVTASGDENYKPLPADTKITLEFTEAGGIIYNPIEIIYGDNTQIVLDYITSPNPADDPATVSYTYSGYDTSIIEVDTDGKITAKHTGETYITLKRVDSADSSEMEQRIKVKVKPKEIVIQPKDIYKKVGEMISAAEFELDTEKSGTFYAGDDIGNLVFSCQDNNVEVVDLADGLNGPAELTITAAHTGGTPADKQNYKIIYKTATLYITQDTGLESWISVIPQAGTKLQNGWYNGPVDVKITAMAGSYETISSDGKAPWSNAFAVTENGLLLQDVYFRNPNTLAKASKITKEIQIDTKSPKVMKITAKSSNNKLEDILNTLTGGIFFKPGTEFTLTTSDQLDANVKDTSGTKEVIYSIYKIEGGKETEIRKDQVLSITDETGKIKISDSSGTYKVCTKAKDNAENEQETEACTKVTIGYENTNISTNDGACPDLNLDFNDDGTPELNIDLDGNGIPDMNIDSDFNGEPDINVDSDDDGRPDLNLVMLDSWNPGICNIVDGKEYATQEGIEPKINVVMDNETDPIKAQVPSLNIDTDGDMKADFNISLDGKAAQLNIGKVPDVWTPETEYTYEDFQYDTMKDLEPLLNMGIIDDKYPSINIDTNGNGKADINIDVNGDGVPDINIDGNGDGKANINIDKDGNGTADEYIVTIKEWNPSKQVNGKVPYKTMLVTYEEEKGNSELEDNGIIIEKPDGTFLPNYAIKVNDVTKNMKDTVSTEAKNQINDNQEVKVVYDVKLLSEGVEVQPDGSIKVKVPIPKGVKNPKLIMKKADGSYETIEASIEDGYLVYNAKELGTVSVVGDKAEDTAAPVNNNAATSVQGNYTNTTQGVGGASTGDNTQTWMYFVLLCGSVIALYTLKMKKSS